MKGPVWSLCQLGCPYSCPEKFLSLGLARQAVKVARLRKVERSVARWCATAQLLVDGMGKTEPKLVLTGYSDQNPNLAAAC